VDCATPGGQKKRSFQGISYRLFWFPSLLFRPVSSPHLPKVGVQQFARTSASQSSSSAVCAFGFREASGWFIFSSSGNWRFGQGQKNHLIHEGQNFMLLDLAFCRPAATGSREFRNDSFEP
jgi:hypothetical protein